jgi:cysteine desulfurase
MKAIYLDHNATTPLDPRVLDAMMPYLREEYGNPSCRYGPGVNAAYAVERARLQVAKLLGAKPGEIIFTSGGTESNNLALRGAVRSMGRKHIVTTSVEHPAVLNTCKDLEHYENCTLSILPVDAEGRIAPHKVIRAVTARTAVVSVMTANNEIGTIQPIVQIGSLLQKEDVLFHTDAVQAFGRIPLNVVNLHVDLLSLSGHKIFGPKGIGALYIREGVSLRPQITGGQQEFGLRGGTPNVPAIAGLGMAAELARLEMDNRSARITSLAERLRDRLLSDIPGLLINSPPRDCLPGTLNISIPGVSAPRLVESLDREGICVSSGCACSEGKQGPSQVVLAVTGDPDRAMSCIRFSIGPENTMDEINHVALTLPKILSHPTP